MPIRSTLSRLALALLVLAGSSQVQAAGKCERLIATGNPDQAPYLWRDPQNPQQLIGAGADLLKALGSELGVTVELLYGGKAAAAEADALNGRVDLLVGSYLTPERLEQFDFVHPAYLDVPVQVWTQRDRAPLFTRYADLASHRGLAVDAGNFPVALARQADEQFKARRTGKAVEALQQLQQGRVDYLLLEGQAGRALVEREGLGGELLPLEPVLASEPLYLAISHNSACNDPWLRGQLARKMTEFRSAGLPQALLHRNMERWKNQARRPATP
ncbi:substrate-binding periplasmic protein [Pseudomonas sp. AN-1]|uniref:substrate-binding periplasmic protein n=1 Tax=Pseudomonas sp. AN-1 TaxID=3096605 RepID=UPI002A699BFD|nr:transporter substrate-binding domain-containing protein [Pseudomonas sp. AN-1]WPP46027.1 transporter substrate-binding domain-containing protein [Pseudomonas sp. AN-1]